MDIGPGVVEVVESAMFVVGVDRDVVEYLDERLLVCDERLNVSDRDLQVIDEMLLLLPDER